MRDDQANIQSFFLIGLARDGQFYRGILDKRDPHSWTIVWTKITEITV